MLAVISPFMIPLAAAALSLDYLRRQLLPQAPSTSPVSEPYTPPFEGGQCPTFYTVRVSFVEISTGNRIPPYDAFTVQAPVLGIEPFNNVNGSSGVRVITANGTNTEQANASFYRDYEATLRRSDGLEDDCGNLPNPNPPPSVAADGLANSSPPDIASDDDLVLGAPLVTIPPLGAALAAIAAAVAAAATALDALKKIMDAIQAIGDVLDKIKDWLDDSDKDKRKKKTLAFHNYGSIRKDGFLRLYPSAEPEGFEPAYIDLQLLSIPIGYGKYFGNLSPNFYRFKSLGHISFVSSSFGILSTHEIEFTRTSINVPDNAFGFYYHIGLEDIIRANVSLFYLKSQTT